MIVNEKDTPATGYQTLSQARAASNPLPAPAAPPAPTGTAYTFSLINQGLEQATQYYNFTIERMKTEPEKIDFSKLTDSYSADLIIEWLDQKFSSLELLLPQIKKLSPSTKLEVAKKMVIFAKREKPHVQENVSNTILPSLEFSKESFLSILVDTETDVIPHKHLKTLKLTPEEQFSFLLSLAETIPSSVHLHVSFFETTSIQRFEVFLKSVSLSSDPKKNNLTKMASAAFNLKRLVYFRLEKALYLQVITLLSAPLDGFEPKGDIYLEGVIGKGILSSQHPREFRFDVAKIIAPLNPELLALYADLTDFDEEQRLELFKEALSKYPKTAFRFYSYFKIDDAKKKDVIEEAADIAPLELLNNQTTFPMDDDTRRNTLATAATNLPKKTAEVFDAKWLSKEDDRLHIAELIAQRDGEAMGINIDKFQLLEPGRFKSAEKAVEQNPKAMLTLLTRYQLIVANFNTIQDRANKLLLL